MHLRGRPPEPGSVLRAVELYVQWAYSGPLPSRTQDLIDALGRLRGSDFYTSGHLDPEPAGDDPHRYRLRLGNRLYPYMQLVIERGPGGQRWFFRADTHDAHIRPEATDRDRAAFDTLMEANRRIAQRVEEAWERDGLPTFKGYLRERLRSRRELDEG